MIRVKLRAHQNASSARGSALTLYKWNFLKSEVPSCDPQFMDSSIFEFTLGSPYLWKLPNMICSLRLDMSISFHSCESLHRRKDAPKASSTLQPFFGK